ncbi:preprotein translocase subunit SecA [Treponema sp.]|uniref:preprotein translocase subunit SecA n=1 Tax=Treponema sp. TaxID=166 RepID=UPI002A838CB4|nr:preprotein translocase subunit SecA [Treponema sp.]MCI6443269.1 preprotein translocase subunit SecA [Spirochaetia bacterium]MDY4132582.1 preprotein translocase subunit SecA [Treponema sp.]
MFDKVLTFVFGSANDRAVKALEPVVAKIEAREPWAQSFKDEEFPEQTKILKDRLAKGETLDDILVDAFALAREAAKRVLGERAYPCQLMGSLVLNSGKITEMKTGEGKTLMCVCAAYLNSLSGKGVHIVTVNEYLAERDSKWMGRVYKFLGQTVGCILSNMSNEARKAAYNCDLTYGTNSEFGFDYLRDNMQIEMAAKVQRGFNFCIVDEIDSILIDEARTPLIISGQAEDDTFKFHEVDKYVGQFKEVEKDPKTNDYPDEVDMTPEQREALEGDYKLDEKSKRVSFTDKGMNKINDILLKQHLIAEGTTVFDSENFEYVHYFTQAVRAHTLYHNDVDYVVQEGQVQIVDEFTGRILEGRRYGDGLHQAIEAKEHLKIAQKSRTLATITYQNFFRMYDKLSGMTGTAETEAVEFSKIYELDVVAIPTHRPVARKDEDDEVYLNEADKWVAIAKEVKEAHAKGQPVLIGTVSVEKSEHLSAILTRNGIPHEVLNAKNHEREAHIIENAGAKGAVTVATNMAGRGTDIKLGGSIESRAKKRAGTDASEEKLEEARKMEYDKWLADCNEVKALGGLYVIGSERHESRRIDNQLRGRSGRQGDPGRSKFYISMDDDLMRLFGGEKMKAIMSRIGMQPGEPINHPMLNRSIEKAQKKVEERNFEIRKHLLDYDDVLNQQRKFIYGQRDEILMDENLSTRVLNNALETVDDIFATYGNAKGNSKSQLADKIRTTFGQNVEYDRLTPEGVKAILQDDITQKEMLVGKQQLNMFIRYQYIQMIDKKWLDQLEFLDGLKESVHLRGYGQKNPLTEYKNDGFDAFDEMLGFIRDTVSSLIFKVKVQVNGEPAPKRVMPTQMDAKHEDASAQSPMAAASKSNSSFNARQAHQGARDSAMKSGRQGQGVTVVRAQPKVGRNDPCPCGSGKKYKVCHGRGM